MNVMMWIVVCLLCKIWFWNFDDSWVDSCWWFMMMVIYVDEFLHAKWQRYWWWMHVWKMKTKMMTICLLNVCIVESYVHAFISRIFISNEDDQNTLYSNDGDYDTVVCWGDDLDDDRYHKYIESCLGALHTLDNWLNVSYLIMCLVNLDDLCALVNLVNYVLDEIWWICEDVESVLVWLLYLYAWCIIMMLGCCD